MKKVKRWKGSRPRETDQKGAHFRRLKKGRGARLAISRSNLWVALRSRVDRLGSQPNGNLPRTFGDDITPGTTDRKGAADLGTQHPASSLFATPAANQFSLSREKVRLTRQRRQPRGRPRVRVRQRPRVRLAVSAAAGGGRGGWTGKGSAGRSEPGGGGQRAVRRSRAPTSGGKGRRPRRPDCPPLPREARVPAARACAARRPRERALSPVHALAVSVTHQLRHQHQHRRHRPPSAAATTDTFSSAFLYCPRPLSTIR